MVAGIAFTGAYIIYFKFIDPAANNASNWWFGISPEGIGTLGMLLNFGVALTIHRFTGDAPEEIQTMVEDLRYPKGAGDATEH